LKTSKGVAGHSEIERLAVSIRANLNTKGEISMASLRDKVAIVTGSSRGIGRAIAERFAADGAAVVVNYARSGDEARSVVAAIEAKGGKAIGIQADGGVVADIRRLFRETIAKFGHVDIVVNNAGATGVPKPIAEITEEEFDSLFAVYGRGPFFVMQEAARVLPDGGRIINISTVGTAMLPPFSSTYVGSKAAMEAFSGVLAAELAPRRITVNCVLPGAVETKLLRSLPQEIQDGYEQRTPFGVGQPRDIAGVVALLAGVEGRWITNEKIRCDGGAR
jgi:3-oxoacyl-[acyl-carrier protein] reductase